MYVIQQSNHKRLHVIQLIVTLLLL